MCLMSDCMRVRLTAVDNLDARVISRLPFSPNRAGTSINISFSCMYTSQCCKEARTQLNFQHQNIICKVNSQHQLVLSHIVYATS